MSYFDDDYLNFFVELGYNNSKDWFDKNRKRYERHVREPFKRFITDLLFKVQEIDPEVKIEPKNAIFRINRDIRFSKDKTPYKTHMGAVLGRTKRKEPDFASFYIQISPMRSFAGGGAYFLERDGLLKLRRYIAQRVPDLKRILEEKNFRTSFPEVHGEKNKRLPPEFKGVDYPLIANKKFYISHTLDVKSILSLNLIDEVMDLYKTMLPFLQFFRGAHKQ
jgi:uncharacterized protein (TIGR02453 family)